MNTSFDFEGEESDIELGDSFEFDETEGEWEAESGRRRRRPWRVAGPRPVGQRASPSRQFGKPRPRPLRPRPRLPTRPRPPVRTVFPVILPPWGTWLPQPPVFPPPLAEPPAPAPAKPSGAQPSYGEPSAPEPSDAEPPEPTIAAEPTAAEPPPAEPQDHEPPSEPAEPAAPDEPPTEELFRPEAFEFKPEPFAFDAESGELAGEWPEAENHSQYEDNWRSADYIRSVQDTLNRVLGLRLAIDGTIGPQTRSAIRTFQQQHGLVVDGTVGPRTGAALNAVGGARTAPRAPSAPAGASARPGTSAVGATSGIGARAAAIAIEELNRWNQGATKESSPNMRATLEDYWRTGVGWLPNQPNWWSSVPWSAAFISWVMKKAGAGNAFKYSAGHSYYTKAAKDNRFANNDNPFKAYRISEVAPQVGDIVCKSRAGSGATYDSIQPGMATHCDIVTEVQRGHLTTVGGNVSQSVSSTTVPTDARGLITHPNYFAVIKVGASPASADGVGGQELQGDLPDDSELDYEEARLFEHTKTAGPIRAGTVTVDKVPLLRRHAGIGPDLILAWSDMHAAPRSVDVVVHLHGYSLRKGVRLHIGRDLKARSGLDWSDPTTKDSTQGRTRPTLALLPRGHFFGGPGGRGYSFPALAAAGGLRQLIDFGLERLAKSLGVGSLTCNRLILTAHSGGGAALLRILNHVDPHEVHVFDGLYQDASSLIQWAKRRITRDQSAAARGAGALERYMAEQGGALRVLYGAGTARYSGPVAEALQRAIPLHSPLRRWYRVERTATGHLQIPPVYGWRLLANAAADLPNVPYAPKGRQSQEAARAIATKAAGEEFEWGAPSEMAYEEEVLVTAPPPARNLVWPKATEEQREFMRRVYQRHVARSARSRPFVPSLPRTDVGHVEYGARMRKAAAASCVTMLARARAALASDRAQGNAAALQVREFGARSGYRSVESQFNNWQSAFRRKYYQDTQRDRANLPGGPHGEAAATRMVEYVGKRIAAPGFSLHNSGLAMDFFTKEGQLSLGPNTNPRSVAAWKRTWLFDWLSRNARAYHFFQNTNIDEPWHWEYRGPGISPGRTASIASELDIQSEAPPPRPQPSQPQPPGPAPAGQCGFRPSQHGFRFANYFTLPSVITSPLNRLGIHVGSGAYGLCGGMSFLAADLFSFRIPRPTTSTVPSIRSRLYLKLVGRQLDSLKLKPTVARIGPVPLPAPRPGFAAPVLKFWVWMGLPDHGSGSVAQRTVAEIATINPTMRRGKFAVLGLVLASRSTGSLTDNHQVLAYCLTQRSPNNFVYAIYDPNHPLRDDIRIEVQVIGGEARATHVIPAAGGSAATRKPIRGFFNMPYSPVRP